MSIEADFRVGEALAEPHFPHAASTYRLRPGAPGSASRFLTQLSPNLKRPKVGAGRQNIGNRRKKAIF